MRGRNVGQAVDQSRPGWPSERACAGAAVDLITARAGDARVIAAAAVDVVRAAAALNEIVAIARPEPGRGGYCPVDRDLSGPPPPVGPPTPPLSESLRHAAAAD